MQLTTFAGQDQTTAIEGIYEPAGMPPWLANTLADNESDSYLSNQPQQAPGQRRMAAEEAGEPSGDLHVPSDAWYNVRRIATVCLADIVSSRLLVREPTFRSFLAASQVLVLSSFDPY